MPEPSRLCNGRELTDDALAGGFRLWQRRRGHRYSLDDVATAWRALQVAPDAETVLDLGTGVGSVLLMLAYKLPGARLCGIEAQQMSYDLAVRNACRNRVRSRLKLMCSDFRQPAVLEDLARWADVPDGFRLVTGTPPYQPTGCGPVSPDPQRAYARFELRGGVEAYLRAAARVLHPHGRLVVCADARRPERVTDSAAELGLGVLERMDVIPIAEHKPALFSVFVLARHGGGPVVAPVIVPPLVARDASGARTEQARELRRFFDLPVAAFEPPSPRMRRRASGSRGLREPIASHSTPEEGP